MSSVAQPAIILKHPRCQVALRTQDEQTPESVSSAKAHQQLERQRAIRDMGIPRDLVDLFEVYGDTQMNGWIAAIRALRSE